MFDLVFKGEKLPGQGECRAAVFQIFTSCGVITNSLFDKRDLLFGVETHDHIGTSLGILVSALCICAGEGHGNSQLGWICLFAYKRGSIAKETRSDTRAKYIMSSIQIFPKAISL
eukprot:1198399-Amorphochlora_amoeboformis.AAC.1